jgi:sugar O-acyltransferase (sialic acid O-acetyltransferase NeuD family)
VTRPLLIIGTGGFARETAAAVRADPEGRWQLVGFLDDDPSRVGTAVDGIKVLGPSDEVSEHPAASVVVCTGNPRDYASRHRIVRRLGLDAERYATIVHPSSSIGYGSTVGVGTVLLAHAVLTADVTIGIHVACMPHVTLTHDDVVEDFSTMASGVGVGGSARIGTGAYLGAGAVLREGVTIGDWSLIGAGSLVLSDIPARCVAYGQPARPIRSTAPRLD